MSRIRSGLSFVVGLGLAAVPALAVVQSQKPIDAVQFRSESLVISSDVRAAAMSRRSPAMSD